MKTTQFTTIVLVLGGLFFVVPGIWALVAPHSFYDQVVTFPPYNRHLLHDIGAFQIGIGVALLLALVSRDATFVALTGAAAGAIAHFISHIVDYDLGGQDTDVFVFGAVAALLVVAAGLRWSTVMHDGAR